MSHTIKYTEIGISRIGWLTNRGELIYAMFNLEHLSNIQYLFTQSSENINKHQIFAIMLKYLI